MRMKIQIEIDDTVILNDDVEGVVEFVNHEFEQIYVNNSWYYVWEIKEANGLIIENVDKLTVKS